MKVGLISYVNSLPMRHNFPKEWELVSGTPAELSDKFFAGELDAAMISLVEYLKHGEDKVLVPGISISCQGACGSVFLKASKPLCELKKILISPESRSSNFYASILFPQCKEWSDSGEADGQVVIGDRALSLDAIECYDLSKLWFDRTKLPTVFAVMLAKNDELAYEIERNLLPIIKYNLDNLEQVLKLYPGKECYID
ncbi:MAG: MqnA/MqnD/SBP family protein, partial [Lentisphaeria bacterium]